MLLLCRLSCKSLVMATHEELVAELPKLEKLSNAARLKLAKKRRLKQLKKYQEYTRVTRQVSQNERSGTKVNFAQNSLLHDAVTRDDLSEGIKRRANSDSVFTLLFHFLANSVERLLREGVNPNDSNADGLTPLHRV